MKKFLSVLLALTMIFSSVAFAAPSMMGTVNTAEETQAVQETENDAVVMEETAQGIYDEQYGLLVAKMDFENDNISLGKKLQSNLNLSEIGYTTPVLPEGFPEGGLIFRYSGTSIVPTKSEDGTNTYGYFTKTAGTDEYCKIGFAGQDYLPMPAGTYTIKANIKTLTKNGEAITESTSVTSWTGDVYLAKDGGAFGDEWNYLIKSAEVKDTIANGHWNLAHSFRFLDGEDYVLNGKTEGIPFNGVSGVFFMFNDGAENGFTYEMDNFELYYKAPVTVSFDNGNNNEATLVGADGSITVHNGAKINTSAYYYTNTADKLFKGWRDQNGNSVPNGNVVVTEDTVLTAQWEDAYHDDYGMLVAAVDFEKLALNSTWANGKKRLASEVGIIADNYPENFPVMYVQHTASSGTIEGSDSDKYLTFYTEKTNGAGNQSWPRISFITADNKASHGFFPEGSYTMVWTLKDDETRNVNVSSSKNANNIYWWNGTSYNEINLGFATYPNTAITSGLKAGWSTTVAQKGILEGDTVSSGIGVFKGIGAFQAMPTVTATKDAIVGKTTNSKGETVDAYTYKCYTFIDDVKLYYKAPVTISYVDTKGYATTLPEATKYSFGTSLTIPAITTTKTNTKFMGWAYEEDGAVITDGKITPNGSTTLYAVWSEAEDHPKYGKMLFSLDFDNVTTYKNDVAMSNYGYVNVNDPNSVNWKLNATGSTETKNLIYSENKDGQVIYINGVKQVGEDITDYKVVNNYLVITGSSKWPQLQIYSTGISNKDTSCDFEKEGYFTLTSKNAYDLAEVNGVTNKIAESGLVGFQFRPTTFYSADAPAIKKSDSSSATYMQDNLFAYTMESGRTGNVENLWVTSTGTNNKNGFGLSGDYIHPDKEPPYESHTSVRRILINYTYSTLTNKSVDLLKFDDIALYWKPYTANLTLDLGNGETLALLTDYDTINIVDADTVLGENANAVIGGKMLKGISKTQGGEAITEDFYLTENTTVYPVWSDDASDLAPVVSKSNSIRTDSHNGIRFLASVTKNQKKYATEYGFIVTRSTILANLGLENTDLRFDMDRQDAYVYGANYIKGTQTDLIFKTTENEIFFTGVVTGMPAEKRFYEEDMVARPYIKYNDGTIVYGDANSRSVLSVAEAIRDNGFVNDDGSAMSQSAVSFIKNILSICGVATEA